MTLKTTQQITKVNTKNGTVKIVSHPCVISEGDIISLELSSCKSYSWFKVEVQHANGERFRCNEIAESNLRNVMRCCEGVEL